jgi:hypothetical protein
VGCTTGATPDCDGGNSGCGPGFDGPPEEAATDAVNDVAPDVSTDASPDEAADASDAAADVVSAMDAAQATQG